MKEQTYQEMYENLKKSSIGRHKRCKAKRFKQRVTLKVAISTILATLCATCLIGCKNNNNHYSKNNNYNNTTYVTEYTNTNFEAPNNYSPSSNSYSPSEISRYQTLRVNELMTSYNMTDYQKDPDNNRKRIYNYTSEDYKQMKELDETYIYGYYLLADSKTVDNVCDALGYSNLYTYLTVNSYVDSQGSPSVEKWYDANTIVMQNIMLEQAEKGKSK